MGENKWKRFFADYFLVQAETVLGMAVIGSIFARDVQIDFTYFFIPAILGAMYMLPCLILYLKEDLKIWQIILQRIVEWIFIEAGTMFVVKMTLKDKTTFPIYVAVFISVLVFEVLTYVISDQLEIKEVALLNKKLKEMKEEGLQEEPPKIDEK